MKISWCSVNSDCSFFCFYIVYIHICFKQKLKDRIGIITSKDDDTFVVKEVRYRT